MLTLNKTYTMEISGMSSDGEGVGRIEHEVVFVPGAIVGEICRVKIINIGKTCAHGALISVEKASPHRITPDCPYFENCGGCDFRHMDYTQELEIKRQRVFDALTRIGGAEVENLPITGSSCTDGYRNKMQYPVQEQNGKACAGFYAARTHRVTSIEHCRLQPECADRVRRAPAAT
ncbi:MAG: TRAM domain-containing protein, partial [Clostridia bacterium]|nr:TRAM domain-containing protein [Clostridia bacterium]